MLAWLTFLSVSVVSSLPSQHQPRTTRWQYENQQHVLDPVSKSPQRRPQLLLPMFDQEPSERKREIERKQHGYLYGPSLLGNTSYFPTGSEGSVMVQDHQDQWYSDAKWLVDTVAKEAEAAAAALDKAGGLQRPSDYHYLYKGQWENSVPGGAASGIFSNYTSDLLFAMERLSVNPYAVRRLHPTTEELPFALDPATSRDLTGRSLEELHRDGHLFFVDHSYQAKYPTSKGRYTAACSAYFYIHPESGDFLPLAIKTHPETDLVYTPLDDEIDWLLAKAMFNMNDLFHGQIFHLANSHAVSEIVHLAALRTLGANHPVLVLLERLMYQAYAIRPVGETVLFNQGGLFDQSFAINNIGVRMFATEFYQGLAASFQSNYFHNDLLSRGLLNCTYGPPLKSIPFFQDASILHSSIHRFMTSFVDAYYTSESLLALDHELQSWVREATEKALVVDFPPSPLVHKSTLVDILTHIAFLNGVSHHVLNSGEPVATSGVLPLHPSAFYAPIPTAKGVKDPMPFLPPAQKAVEQISLLARFNRPRLADQHGTLAYMFSGGELWERGCHSVVQASDRFYQEMEAFSKVIQAREFDDEGLCQGMPFVWKGLDPSKIPYFLSV